MSRGIKGQFCGGSVCRSSGVVIDGHLKRIENASLLDMDDPAASRIVRDFQDKLKTQHNT